MSDMLRIALVAEGPTDWVVIQAGLKALLPSQAFDLKLLQPETSAAFSGGFGSSGSGWGGVYRWCRQAVARHQSTLSDDPLFRHYDLLIMHLDADVAGKTYAQANIEDWLDCDLSCDLPCEMPCPPVDGTTDKLCQVILGWLEEPCAPDKMIFCIPSKSTEAWVMKALFPNDKEMNKTGWECHPQPESRLSQQRKKWRIKKSTADYKKCQDKITNYWPKLISDLIAVRRFSADVRASINQH